MAQGDSPDRPAHSPTEKGGSPRVFRFLTFLLPGLFLLLQIYLLFGLNVETLDYPRYTNQEPLPLFGENKNVTQEFRSPGPLSRIDIMMANYKITSQSGSLRLSIFNANQRLFLKNYPANTVEDNRFYSFTLDPAKFPAGNYRLQLNFFPANPNEKLAAWTSKENLYPYGSLYVNNTPQTGDLTFRVYYNSTPWKEKSRWLLLSPQSKLRGPFLTISLVLFLIAVNFLFYYFTRKLLS